MTQKAQTFGKTFFRTRICVMMIGIFSKI